MHSYAFERLDWEMEAYDTIWYCVFNVQSKADRLAILVYDMEQRKILTKTN